MDFQPTATWVNLRARAALLRRMREFFDRRGFLEVETPLLSRDTVVDLHLDPLPVNLFTDPSQPELGRRMWLQTSPEFGMKRLLAAGAEAIYQVTKAFRAGEQGSRHNPEFTLVEWYRVGDGMASAIQMLSELAAELLDAPAADRCSYQAAFLEHVGVDPHTASVADLREAATANGVTSPPSMATAGRDEWLNLLLAECVEPRLGDSRPLILYDYPASQAALARVRPGDPPVAERFELYVDGIELANGYHELLEPDVLVRRNRQANLDRRAAGKYPLPEESRLLDAMRQGLPACSGVALGFDRLVMVALGAREISQVIAFPIERA